MIDFYPVNANPVTYALSGLIHELCKEGGNDIFYLGEKLDFIISQLKEA